METFPLNNPDDPETFYLDPDRWERVRIPTAPPPEQNPAERDKNFQPVFLGYSEGQAVIEATRCIHCPATEPCIIGCPVHNDIPKALFAIEQGRYDDAADIFRLTSNFPEVCGRLCPQEVLCEGSCTVAGYDRAVNIGKCEAFCTDWQRTARRLPQPAAAARHRAERGGGRQRSRRPGGGRRAERAAGIPSSSTKNGRNPAGCCITASPASSWARISWRPNSTT